MAKRKKYPKLPNGFGSIKYLGKGRRNPYAVHPPTKEFTLEGVPKTPKAIAYTDTWIKGFSILTAYNAGTYEPGSNLDLLDSSGDADDVAQKILADYNHFIGSDANNQPNKTFSDVYEEFFENKFESGRTYGISTQRTVRAAYNNCKDLHSKDFVDLRHKDLQEVVDSCKLKHASLEHIISLLHQMYRYAIAYDIVERDYSAAVRINREDDEEGETPFTEGDLRILWENKNNESIELLLIMCYSGHRISEYRVVEVNLKDAYFKGGIKTRTSKERIVPIHSAILPLVEKRLQRNDGALLNCGYWKINNDIKKALAKLGIQEHTPHACRHTFSMLCEKYKVAENDRKRMLGHKFKDVTNRVYGHRDIEDLRTEIEKIKICY